MALDALTRNSRPLRWLLLILLLALGLRLGWSLTRPVSDTAIDSLPDQREYLSLAQNLLHRRGLQFLDKRFSDTVWAFRTPGYPLFVYACGANVRAVRVVQSVVGTSIVLAVYLLAGLLAGGGARWRIGLAAAFLVALDPFMIYFTGLVLSETLFTAMLVWGMYLLVRGGGGQSDRWGPTLLWLCGGALLALSVLVRPSALALPVVLGIAAAFLNRRGAGAYQQAGDTSTPIRPRWPIPTATTMLLLTILALLPWSLRNLRVLGHWVWLDTNAGFTLYDAYNPDATGGSDQSYITREPELQSLGEIARSDYLSQAAWSYLLTHRAGAVHLAFARLARTWSPVPLSADYHGVMYRLIGLAYAVPLEILIVVGLLWGNLPRSAKVLLLLPAIYLSIVHALTIGSLRYRLPAEPPLAVIAAGLAGAWGGTASAWRRSPAA